MRRRNTLTIESRKNRELGMIGRTSTKREQEIETIVDRNVNRISN